MPAIGAAALAVLVLATIAWLVWRTPRENERKLSSFRRRPRLHNKPITGTIFPPQPQAALVVAQLNDGEGVLSLDQEGKLSGADTLPPGYQNLVKKALSSQRIERSSQLQGLTRPSSSLMGSGNQTTRVFSA